MKPVAIFVDDSLTTLEMFRKMCDVIDLKAIFSNDVDEAFDLINEHPSINTVFLDLKMPKLNGFQFAKKIRNRFSTKSFNICCISSFSDKSYIDMAIKQGITDYMVKPIDIDIFSNKVSKYVNSVKSLKLFEKKVDIELDAKQLPFEISFQMKKISEVGGELDSKLEIKKDSILLVKSEELEFLENNEHINYFTIRVLDTERVKKNKFKIKFEFMNLKYISLKKLRSFIIT